MKTKMKTKDMTYPRDFRLRPCAIFTAELASHVDEGWHVRPRIRPRSRGWAIIALDVIQRTESHANAGRMVVPMVLAGVEQAVVMTRTMQTTTAT